MTVGVSDWASQSEAFPGILYGYETVGRPEQVRRDAQTPSILLIRRQTNAATRPKSKG
jgi:hypothetical protein